MVARYPQADDPGLARRGRHSCPLPGQHFYALLFGSTLTVVQLVIYKDGNLPRVFAIVVGTPLRASRSPGHRSLALRHIERPRDHL